MLVGVSDNDKCVNDTMVSVCMCRCVCVCVCHCTCSLSSWVQGTCLAHITSIKVLSRSLPRKSLFTSPTLLKSLSGDAEVAAWPSGPGEGTLARAASTTSEGLCQGAPASLSCRKVYLSIVYLTVKAFKFHCQRKPWPSRCLDVGKCLSSQKLRDLVFSLACLFGRS